MSEIKSMIKEAAILLVITLVAGLILGYVYEITKGPIALAKEKAANEAYQEVFADAASFEEVDTVNVEADSDYEASYSGVSVDKVLEAKKDAETLGYVLTVTSHEGYGGDITMTVGIRKDGTVNGISLLSISETAGLGMRAEEVLKPQFKDKNVSEFTYTKTGATMDSQIDAISGATITTKAVTKAVNAALYVFQTKLGGAQ